MNPGCMADFTRWNVRVRTDAQCGGAANVVSGRGAAAAPMIAP